MIILNSYFLCKECLQACSKIQWEYVWKVLYKLGTVTTCSDLYFGNEN